MSDFPDIYGMIDTLCKQKGTNVFQLSKVLKKSYSNFVNQLKSKNVKASLLLEISNVLGENLFQVFTYLLKEEARSTSTERQLRYHLAETQKELEQVKAERDKYWDAIAGKLAKT